MVNKAKRLYWLVVIIIMFVIERVESFETLEQCPPVNIFATHDSIYYYVKSVKYLQHSILVENLSGLRPGSGLGISWAKVPQEDNSYSLQIAFKHYLVVCCIALNRNITNVREYDIKLLDKNGNYLVPAQANDPTKFSADANLFVDLSKKAMGSYGVELTVRRTAHIGEPPANIEISMMLCEKSANVSEKLRQQQLNAAKVKDMYLLDTCTSHDQCDKLITGNAACENGMCKCTNGAYEINKFECSKDNNEIENLSFGSKNINTNFIDRSKNRMVRFVELNRIDCIQDRDCQSTFLDLNMLCIKQKCVCTTGYRLLQSPSNFTVKCVKSIGGSTLKYPQNCDAPTGCDFHLSLFVFQAPSNESSPIPTPAQRYVSITLTTDARHYVNEYYQIVLNEEKMKFFVDGDGVMRLVLDDKFNKFYRTLAQQDGFRIRVTREADNPPNDDQDAEPILVRKPRYVLQSLANTSNITKDNSPNDIILQYDPEEYKFLNYYLNIWYYDAGNLTYYNIEFNSNYSSLILNSMFSSGSSSSSTSNDSEPITCLMFKLNRGNFIQMAPPSNAPTKIQFFFESKHMTRLNGFLFCLILNQSNSNQCKNGVQLFEAKYPISSSMFNQTRFYCHCWTGYWGPECDVVNPCYTLLTNTTRVPNPSEPLPFATKLCVNDGVCMPAKSSAMHYYISKLKYVPYCLCRPQFAGKTCERNLDGCTFPFLYGNKFHNKCLLNATTGQPWCGKVINLDAPDVGINGNTTATCAHIPCTRQWKYQSSVQTNKCIYKRYQDEKGYYESPFCSLTRNFELYRTWRFCEKDDFL